MRTGLPSLAGHAISVSEPFDGNEVPAKLLEVQGDPYSLAGMPRSSAR